MPKNINEKKFLKIINSIMWEKIIKLISKNYLYFWFLCFIIAFFIIYVLSKKIDYWVDIIDFINLFVWLTIALIIWMKIDSIKNTKWMIIDFLDDIIKSINQLMDFMKSTCWDNELCNIQINEKQIYIWKIDNKISILIHIVGKDFIDDINIDKIKERYFSFREIISDSPNKSFNDKDYQNKCYSNLFKLEQIIEWLKYSIISK